MPEDRRRVVLTATARQDITGVYEYLCRHSSVAVADDIFAHMLDTMDRIGRYPESGAPRAHVGTNYRMVPVSSWTIWYQYGLLPDDVPIVVRVLHGSMDVERHLLTDKNHED